MLVYCMETGTAMHLMNLQRGLWVASLAAEGLLVTAVLFRGLARRYPLFLLFLCGDAAWGLTLLIGGYGTSRYGDLYRVYLLQTAVLKLAVSAELFERVAAHFEGIGKFRFWMAVYIHRAECGAGDRGVSSGYFGPGMESRPCDGDALRAP